MHAQQKRSKRASTRGLQGGAARVSPSPFMRRRRQSRRARDGGVSALCRRSGAQVKSGAHERMPCPRNAPCGCAKNMLTATRGAQSLVSVARGRPTTVPQRRPRAARGQPAPGRLDVLVQRGHQRALGHRADDRVQLLACGRGEGSTRCSVRRYAPEPGWRRAAGGGRRKMRRKVFREEVFAEAYHS
jgi:hypothetical protein